MRGVRQVPAGRIRQVSAGARAHLAVPIITTDLKVTTDGRRPTHGGEGWALADFFKRPRSLNFVTTLRIFRIGTAKDRPMSATPMKPDIAGPDLFLLTPELLRHRFPRSQSPAHQYLAFACLVLGCGMARARTRPTGGARFHVGRSSAWVRAMTKLLPRPAGAAR